MGCLYGYVTSLKLGKLVIISLKNMGGWWKWALVSPDGVAPSWMVGVSASVNRPLHHKVQKFSSGVSSPGWSRKCGRKTVVVVVVVVVIISQKQCKIEAWSQWKTNRI